MANEDDDGSDNNAPQRRSSAVADGDSGAQFAAAAGNNGDAEPQSLPPDWAVPAQQQAFLSPSTSSAFQSNIHNQQLAQLMARNMPAAASNAASTTSHDHADRASTAGPAERLVGQLNPAAGGSLVNPLQTVTVGQLFTGLGAISGVPGSSTSFATGSFPSGISSGPGDASTRSNQYDSARNGTTAEGVAGDTGFLAAQYQNRAVLQQQRAQAPPLPLASMTAQQHGDRQVPTAPQQLPQAFDANNNIAFPSPRPPNQPSVASNMGQQPQFAPVSQDMEPHRVFASPVPQFSSLTDSQFQVMKAPMAKAQTSDTLTKLLSSTSKNPSDTSDAEATNEKMPAADRTKRIYRHESFPVKLHRLLREAESQGNESIVSYVNDGNGFKVHRVEQFTSEILPRYFRHKKFPSFLRLLSLYGFVRQNEGPHRGAYQHPSFQKGREDLCPLIVRDDKFDRPKKAAPK